MCMDIVEQSSTRIGGICTVLSAIGQFPYQPSVYRPCIQLSGCRHVAGIRDMVQDPFDFCTREVRVQHQACPLLKYVCISCRAHLVTDPGRTPILPDNSGMDWLSGITIPDYRGFSLVRNPDCPDIIAQQAACLQDFTGYG